MNLPLVRQCPSPNYSPTPISHDLFVWHRMEGGYAGSIAWLCRPATQASAQGLMKADGSEDTQLVPMMYKAWHACAFNGRGVGWEIEGFTKDGMADVTINAAALRAALYCLRYGVPPVWAEGGQGRGICTHHDLGVGGGGHVDICGVGDELWRRCVTATQNAYAELKALPSLPAWGLHGLPGPADVTPPAFVTPEPSHGGAARKEPHDTIRHPTPSGYPTHSVAALQADLNAIMGAGLDVDGGYGPLSVAALERFQAMHGLVVDGVPGPMTWAAIDGALTTAQAA